MTIFAIGNILCLKKGKEEWLEHKILRMEVFNILMDILMGKDRELWNGILGIWVCIMVRKWRWVRNSIS